MKARRNDPCPCGSGRKAKKCCLGKADLRTSTPSKPTGVAGATKVSIGPNGSSAQFLKLEFPREKEQIEIMIARNFISDATRAGLLPYQVQSATQNPEDDLDFTLETSSGRKYLELMEVAPLEGTRPRFENAPASYNPYEFARGILERILGKSDRYRTPGIILVLYITHWTFVPSKSTLELLQLWTQEHEHCFDAIYFYCPIEPDSGITEVVFPTPPERWERFDAEVRRNGIVHNLDPRKWEPIPRQ